MKDTGIYLITNTVSGRRYVGSAASFKKRWREHERQLQEGRHHSRYLQRAWSKHGAVAFTFRPIIYCAKADLIMYEQAAMDALKPEYNIVPTAGSMLGYRHTDETRAKMRAARARNGYFSPMKGRTHSEESKRKLSESRKGKGCGPRNEEWRRNIGLSQKGKVITPEARAKISATLTGCRGCRGKLSEDQVREIRSLHAGGMQQQKIANQMGIHRVTVGQVVRRVNYTWVN